MAKTQEAQEMKVRDSIPFDTQEHMLQEAMLQETAKRMEQMRIRDSMPFETQEHMLQEVKKRMEPGYYEGVRERYVQLITLMREGKPNDRSELDRYWAIALTEAEKAKAVFESLCIAAGNPEVD